MLQRTPADPMRELQAEDAEQLRRSVESYLRSHYDEAEQRRQSDDELTNAGGRWAAFVDALGLAGLGLPEDVGGVGGGFRNQGMILAQFGRALVLEPYLTALMTGRALLASEMADADQLLGEVVAGSLLAALAHGERAGRYDPAQVSMQAHRRGEAYRLSGRKVVVLDAPRATHLLVPARTAGAAGDRDGVSLFLVDATAPGLTRRDYRTISGRPASDLAFEAVSVPADRLLLAEGRALPLLEALLDEACALVCAEGLGVMSRLIDDTTAYVRQRRQFGRPLADFQVVRHRLADMSILREHAVSFVEETLGALAGLGRGARMQRVSATKAYVGKALRFVAQHAVQLHGGMGTTDELFVGRLFKRATEIERQFGTVGYHLERFATFRDAYVGKADDAPASDVENTKNYQGFREDVRAFIDEAYPAGKRALNARQAGLFAEPELGVWWQRELLKKGWGAPSWPVEHGGTGWDPIERQIFASECNLANAPMPAKMGLGLAAPALMKFGTPEQKAYFLPGILSFDIYFCQGFSEPASGSDLASLSTRAVRDGDDYVINGSKIWTTHAQNANWIFLLARTRADGKPQAGISFLLVPMDTPGMTVRPILSMSGEHEVNQVFFDDVRVPVTNRVGEENEGWTVTKYLLEHERGGQAFAAMCSGLLQEAEAIARDEAGDGGDAFWNDPYYRLRFVEHEIDVLALEATENRIAAGFAAGESVGQVLAAMLKVTGSELYQRSAELGMEALGDYALADQRASLTLTSNAPPIGPDYAAKPTAKYLNTRSWTIFAGTNEVLRDVIGSAVVCSK